MFLWRFITISLLFVVIRSQSINETSTTFFEFSTTETTALFAPKWVYGMIISGIIGLFSVSAMGIHSIYHFWKDDLNAKPIRFLYILFFSSYVLCCFSYAFLRTNIIFPMGTLIDCRWGMYITTNFVYVSKMFLLFLFLLRIDLAFHASALGYPRWFLIGVCVFFFTLTTIGNAYYMYCGWNVVTQYPLSDYHTSPIPLQLCAYSDPDAVGLVIFALSSLDFIGFSLCCALFVFKLYKVVKMTKNDAPSAHRLKRSKADSARENKLVRVIKKQTILVSVAAISTFILMGSAGTVEGGISFLLPIDATINTFCVWLMFTFADPVWNKIMHCCCFCCVCCCGKKEDYLMTLRSISRKYSMRDSKGSVSSKTTQSQSQIETQRGQDIEIKFDNDITSQDLNQNKKKKVLKITTTTTSTNTTTTSTTTVEKKEVVEERSVDTPVENSAMELIAKRSESKENDESVI